MKILFLTISGIDNISVRDIYSDLLREFKKNGHDLVIASTIERKFKQPASLKEVDGVKYLRVKTLNIQKTSLIEKGIGILALEYQFKRAIAKYLSDEKFDLVLYSTPPITFTKVINYIKKRDGAKSYLMLKDIFPQNAVDLQMIKKNGLLHRFFLKKERAMYAASDYIGCLSPANIKYVLKHNPEVEKERLEVCTNTIEVESVEIDNQAKINIRNKYNIPQNAVVFIYGGNLGKPQGLDFLLTVLEENKNKKDAYFLTVGSGTEFSKLQSWFQENNIPNAQLLKGLPKEEYNTLVKACDVGLVFLDPRFTIPNYPSRLLSYLENKMPVLMATDVNTDVGSIAEENGYGFWAKNGDLNRFNELIDRFLSNKDLISQMGDKGFRFLNENYTVKQSYDIIMKHFK